MERPLPALDFVAQELEPFSDESNPASSADVNPRPVVSGFGQPPPLRLVPSAVDLPVITTNRKLPVVARIEKSSDHYPPKR
jgi:hypothetical protein